MFLKQHLIKLAAENYPALEFYDTKNEITTLGIGEALVTALDEKSRPMPLAATMLRAPMSRMDYSYRKGVERFNKFFRIN